MEARYGGLHVFERDNNGDLFWLRYEHGDDKFHRAGQPAANISVAELAANSVCKLRGEAERLELQSRLIYAANGSTGLTGNDMEKLLGNLADSVFHLSQQLSALEESLDVEALRVQEERKANEPDPDPPGPEHHLWLAIMKTKPADDDPKLVEWRAECERARVALVSMGKPVAA